jgi:hypothetical protein
MLFLDGSLAQFNRKYHSNFKSVLRKYVEMVRSNFNGKFPAFVCAAIDVDTSALPRRIRLEVSRIVRDTAIARELKDTYAGTCQVCREKLELAPREFHIEAHYLKPLGRPHNGPDVKGNIVRVCPNCHVLLDCGVLPIGPKTFRLKLHDIEIEFIKYHNDYCAKS